MGRWKSIKHKFGIFSIPGDFHFWNLVNAAFSSSTVMFLRSCCFTFSFSFSIFAVQLTDILESFFCLHTSFQDFSIQSLPKLGFSLFLYRTFWHPSGRSYFICRICYVYQIVFPSVLLLIFFALVSLWYFEYHWHLWFYTFL